MLNSDWLKTKLRLIVQDLRLIVTFMQRAHYSYVHVHFYIVAIY